MDLSVLTRRKHGPDLGRGMGDLPLEAGDVVTALALNAAQGFVIITHVSTLSVSTRSFGGIGPDQPIEKLESFEEGLDHDPLVPAVGAHVIDIPEET